MAVKAMLSKLGHRQLLVWRLWMGQVVRRKRWEVLNMMVCLMRQRFRTGLQLKTQCHWFQPGPWKAGYSLAMLL
jgi:hypothetical protein